MTQPNGTTLKERRKDNIIELLTLKEVAELCRVSLPTVRYWISMRRIKPVKLGRHPLVKRAELLRFIVSAEAGGPVRESLNNRNI